jgi:hypothetical protein
MVVAAIGSPLGPLWQRAKQFPYVVLNLMFGALQSPCHPAVVPVTGRAPLLDKLNLIRRKSHQERPAFRLHTRQMAGSRMPAISRLSRAGRLGAAAGLPAKR